MSRIQFLTWQRKEPFANALMENRTFCRDFFIGINYFYIQLVFVARSENSGIDGVTFSGSDDRMSFVEFQRAVETQSRFVKVTYCIAVTPEDYPEREKNRLPAGASQR